MEYLLGIPAPFWFVAVLKDFCRKDVFSPMAESTDPSFYQLAYPGPSALVAWSLMLQRCHYKPQST